MPRLPAEALPRARATRSVVVLLVALVAGGTPARAQTTDSSHASAARELFNEGIELADAERWPEAEDRFRRALAFRESPVIAFNLASVLAKQAELTEASELLHGVLRRDDAPASVRDPARALLAEIEPRLSKLTVEVRGVSERDTIALDGRTLRRAELGVPLPIDPGVHSVVATRDGKRLVSDSVRVSEGRTGRVVLDLPDTVPDLTPATAIAAPVEPAPVYDEQPWSEERADSGGASWLIWTGVGVAVVGAAVVAVVLIRNNSKSETEAPFAGDFDPPSLRVVVAP